MEVYMGKLNKKVELTEEVNPLRWMDKDRDFYNLDDYAGEGNIWHMIKRSELYLDLIK